MRVSAARAIAAARCSEASAKCRTVLYSAVQAVQEIFSSSEETRETGGLRLVAELAGTQTDFQLSVVALPGEDDEVIEEEGARVVLDPEAASLLEDKILDASIEPNQVAFTIADQGEE